MNDSGPRFSPMPLLMRTERLVLSPMRPGDAGIYTELISERGPGARGFGTTPAQVGEKIIQMAAAADRDGIGFLALRREPDSEMFGYCGLMVGRTSLQEPEIAYELLRREHGQGYATEAARAVIEAATATGRTKLWATVEHRLAAGDGQDGVSAESHRG